MTEVCCERCLDEFETDSNEDIVICPYCKQWTRVSDWEQLEH